MSYENLLQNMSNSVEVNENNTLLVVPLKEKYLSICIEKDHINLQLFTDIIDTKLIGFEVGMIITKNRERIGPYYSNA